MRNVLDLLELHYATFTAAEPYATATGHPVPMDTRGWSQILITTLTGIRGLDRQKGPDLFDGSDVKGANQWNAIDKPRFNGVLKAGTKSKTSGRIESLDTTPHLYLVLWDETIRRTKRCRIWVIQAQKDQTFRSICQKWYEQYTTGQIKSNNFQLHPPIGQDNNIMKNNCGTLEYPLYLCAERINDQYEIIEYTPSARTEGYCK